MAPLLRKLEETYSERCEGNPNQKTTWMHISKSLPPTLDKQKTERPSLLLAREAGDLGMAMLWIVQSTLVRSLVADLLKEINSSSTLYNTLEGIRDSEIGAFAHNDEHDNPVIITRGKNLNACGKKKFITGGEDIDYLLITAKLKIDEKTSHLLYLPQSDFPGGALTDLKTEFLRTTKNARLILDDFNVRNEYLFPVQPDTLRRTIKRWSIIERGLIMEALLGFIHYLALHAGSREAFPADFADEIDRVLSAYSPVLDGQIKTAREGKIIDETAVPLASFLLIMEKLKSGYEKIKDDLTEDVTARYNDLSFLDKMRI